MRVVVEPYKTHWAEWYLDIKAKLQRVLAEIPYLDIQHVGSTSIPGMAAKPVIDVDIIVSRAQLTPVIQALTDAQYEHFGERGIPDRHSFKPPFQTPAINLYVCVEYSQALRNHLVVRDLCRANVELRDAYARKKIALSSQEWSSVDEYCVAKSDILSEILSHELTSTEIEQIRTVNVTAQDT